MEENIQINLSKDEALILYEFLARFSDDEILEIADQSEELVLWNIHCDLEKILAETLTENYAEILEKARENVRDKI